MDPAPPGLTSKEAGELLKEYGPNSLPEKPPPTEISLLLGQLKSPLVYVLLAALAVSAATREYSDAAIIGVAVVVNTFLGYLQESRAGRALQALKKLVSATVEVLRDGSSIHISAHDLVPKDVVVLKPGLKIPADGVVIVSNRLFVEEAIITGESVPVSKKESDPLYMGTVIVSGLGLMQVKVTGASTKMGAIAEKSQTAKEDTPLQHQLSIFSKKLVYIVLILTTAVFVLGLVSGISWLDMFTLSVAVAVSSIPEGLLVALTVILAIGMQRILKRKGLIKKLASAETLGGVTVICTDKTGTLTEGKLRVVDSIGDQKDLALQIMMSKDDLMVSAARNWADKIVSQETARKFSLIDSIPFAPKEKFFASLNKFDDSHNIVLVNGAPEMILGWTNMPREKIVELENTMTEITSRGNRILGLARKNVPLQTSQLTPDLVKGGLEWVGILVYNDPVRSGVKEVLDKASLAGIRVILITGDHLETAKFVMNEIGLPVSDSDILLGEQITNLSLSDLAAKLKSVKLLARTSPDQKLKIVEALKHSGEVVAMMGDGVNDAPALHQSDIGIVVAEATDVARESADLVLLDSNFGTVLAAIEEGRAIFDNIRKVILYLLCDAFEEIVVIVGSLLLRIPIPIAAVQILWINLFSDGFPSLALTVDPKRVGVMRERPRHPGEPLVNPWMFKTIAILSVLYGVFTLFVLWHVYQSTGDIVFVRSVAYITLGINTSIYVFSFKNLWSPIWKGKLFDNPWLNISLLAGFIMQVIPFTTAGLRQAFDLKIVPIQYWFYAAGASLAMVVIVEVLKLGHQRQKLVIPAPQGLQKPRKR